MLNENEIEIIRNILHEQRDFSRMSTTLFKMFIEEWMEGNEKTGLKISKNKYLMHLLLQKTKYISSVETENLIIN